MGVLVAEMGGIGKGLREIEANSQKTSGSDEFDIEFLGGIP